MPACTIALSRGFSTKVSPEDLPKLSAYKWTARYNPITRSWYASAAAYIDGKKTTLQMGRVILGLEPGDPRQADHENHDTLDNTRQNLRVASPAENCRNRRRRADNTSTFKGVSWCRRLAKWRVQLWVNKTNITIGCFNDPVAAAQAYDAAARHHFGEYAHCNFPTSSR
jgi:hypothetical protein